MSDVGTWMVGNLYQQLMVDDQWSVQRERGFTWWGYRLAQHIEVAAPVHDRGLDLCVFRIWTEVVRNVDADSNPAAVLAQLNNAERTRLGPADSDDLRLLHSHGPSRQRELDEQDSRYGSCPTEHGRALPRASPGTCLWWRAGRDTAPRQRDSTRNGRHPQRSHGSGRPAGA